MQRKEDAAATTDVEETDDQVTPPARKAKERKKPVAVIKGQMDEVVVVSEDVVDMLPDIIGEGADAEDHEELHEHLSLTRRLRAFPRMREKSVRVVTQKAAVGADEVVVVEDAVEVRTAVVAEVDSLVVSIAEDEAVGVAPTVPVIKKSTLEMKRRRKKVPTAPTKNSICYRTAKSLQSKYEFEIF